MSKLIFRIAIFRITAIASFRERAARDRYFKANRPEKYLHPEISANYNKGLSRDAGSLKRTA